MNFNIGSLFFVVVFATRPDILWTAKNFDLNQSPSDDSSEDTEIHEYYASNEVFLGNKRSRSETSPPTEPEKKHAANISHPKYSYNSIPITPEVDSNMRAILETSEKEIIANQYNSVWEDFNQLSEGEATELCLLAWSFEVQMIPELEVHQYLIPVCSSILLAGPSSLGLRYRFYYGLIQYANEAKGMEFSIDMIRCYCALRKRLTQRAVISSKRSFFLNNHNGNMYHVLTLEGPHANRKVKLVNLRELKTSTNTC